MTPLVDLIQTTSYDLTPPHLRPPSFLWITFTTFNRLHAGWRWYRRLELYRNPDNLAQLLAGHLINITMGETFLLRVAAQCLLVATRLLECAQQQATLYHASREWVSAVRGDYPKTIALRWDKTGQQAWLSPSIRYWQKTVILNLQERTKRIAFCSFKILKESFKLSMCIMDTLDAFCWSPAPHNEAINEGFLNIAKWFKAVVEKKEELLEGMVGHKTLIEHLLRHSTLTYEHLHSAVAKAIEKTEFVYRQTEKISDFGKHLANRTMTIIGLKSDLRP